MSALRDHLYYDHVPVLSRHFSALYLLYCRIMASAPWSVSTERAFHAVSEASASDADSSISLSSENMLLQATTVRNTRELYGVVTSLP